MRLSLGASRAVEFRGTQSGSSVQQENLLMRLSLGALRAVEFRAATAIFAGYVSDTLIQHNHIANTTYSGITLGWCAPRWLAVRGIYTDYAVVCLDTIGHPCRGWGREGGGVGNNHIVNNHVERVMTDFCCE